jgi:uncharacterized protein YndB with AHSA1/START domain
MTQQAVIIERIFDAPVELIWRLWTTPQHFAAWYGPEGATVTVTKMDVRVGGSRLFCMMMQTPNGPIQMWFAGEYREVVENVRLVYTECMSDESGNVPAESETAAAAGDLKITEVRVELENLGGRTKVRMTHAGIPADSPGAVGWAMAFDKFAARVAQLSDQS